MNERGPEIEETKQQRKSSRTLPPMIELTFARLRENIRRPETLFWVYGFPIVMIVVLGLAFQNKPIEKFSVDVESTKKGETIVEALRSDKRLEVLQNDAQSARSRLRVGKTDVIVVPASSKDAAVAYEFRYDPTQPRSMLARDAVNEILQEAAGRKDPATVSDVEMKEPGGRYIDFLVPGLLGMSLLGGGIWGVGFATVDMRIRKLLKRFV
jgi:ABC-2 type transport system permease protein